MQIIKVDNFLDLPLPLVGIYDNIQPEIYHSYPAISRSDILDINRSIYYWKNKPKEKSDAMDFGTLVHDIIMFPEHIKNYAFEPDLDRRSKESKEFFALNKDKFIISKSATTIDMPEIVLKKIIENINKNKLAKIFLNTDYCKFEQSVFWIDPGTNIQCKCRPDVIFKLDGVIYIVDLKSCQDASYEVFRRDFKYRQYHVQASYYSEGIKQITNTKKIVFVFIAIEKSYPYDCAIYDIDESTIESSKVIWQKGLEKVKKFYETNEITGYEQTLKTISLRDYEI